MSAGVDSLLNAQDSSGGWGYAAGQKPVVEPTAAALLAVRDEPGAATALGRGLDWLRESQNQDGGWGYNQEDGQSGWQTAWAVLALEKTDSKAGEYERGVKWLAEVRNLLMPEELTLLTDEVPAVSSTDVLCWSWLPSEAYWVEPSALAMAALAEAPRTRLIQARLEGALGYLRKNRCMEGGWGVGNQSVLDTVYRARAYQTAVAMLGLSRFARGEVTQADIQALKGDMRAETSLGAKAIGWLALRVMGEDDEAARDQVAEALQRAGEHNANLFHTALGMLALRGNL